MNDDWRPTQLDQALSLLRGHDGWSLDAPKWIKGNTEDEHGNHCAVGAVNAVRHWGTGYSTALSIEADYRALAEVIREQYPEVVTKWMKKCVMKSKRLGDYGLITYFNDQRKTTFKDIERVFEKAYIQRVGEV